MRIGNLPAATTDCLIVTAIFIIFVNMEEKIKPVFNKRILREINFEQIDYLR